jgi:hypothetical protein
LLEILTPDAIAPQSGERITGAMSCVRVYENYPGLSSASSIRRCDTWVAERS